MIYITIRRSDTTSKMIDVFDHRILEDADNALRNGSRDVLEITEPHIKSPAIIIVLVVEFPLH
jgi:hypothetical protein